MLDTLEPEALYRWLTKRYTSAWLEWEIPVLEATLIRDNVEHGDATLMRALALSSMARFQAFWTGWETFSALCTALLGHAPSGTLQEHTLSDMMRAVHVAAWVRIQTGDPAVFDEQVLKYIAAQALHQSIWVLPPPLNLASPYAARKYYICKDCGNEADITVDDGHCDVCSQRFSADRVIASFSPLLPDKGRNIEIVERNPQKPVMDALAKISNGIPLGEAAEDVCAARIQAALLIVKRALTRRDQQLEKIDAR